MSDPAKGPLGALRGALFLLVLTALWGCRERALLETPSREQRARAAVELTRAGIPLKERESGSRFQLFVAEDDFSAALDVLDSAGLLGAGPSRAEELVAQQGFVPPSPEVAALRYDLALAREAERLLLALPAVVDVRVSVRTQEPRGAVAILRFAGPTANPPFSVDELKGIFRRLIPALASEQIEIRVHRADPFRRLQVGQRLTDFGFPFSFPLPLEYYGRARREVYALCLLLAVSALIVGLRIGVSLGQRQARRSTAVPRKRATKSFVVERGAYEGHHKVSNSLR